jgi:hypothetical protein
MAEAINQQDGTEPSSGGQDALWDVEKDRVQDVGNVLTSKQNMPLIMSALRTSAGLAYERATQDGGYFVDKHYLELVRIRDEIAAISPEAATELTVSENPDYPTAFEAFDKHFEGQKAADVIAERDAQAQS